MGEAGTATESIVQQDFFNGFKEGYQTMDTLGALIIDVVIINAIHSKGMTEAKQVVHYTFITGSIAAVGLSLVYLM